MEAGSPGEDDGFDNPLSRALGRLFSDGQPFQRLVQCFCADRRRHRDCQTMRWFGVFVLSAAGRVIFFPGFSSSTRHVTVIRGVRQMWSGAFDCDHISLEPGCRRWHLTTRGSKRRLGGPQTRALGEGRFLWCGISVRTLDEFRVLKRRTKVRAHLPESDSTRRLGVFVNAREEARFQILDWHPKAWQQSRTGIWHVGLVVAPPGSPTYSGATLGFPDGSPFVAGSLPRGRVRLPARHHHVALSQEIELQITTVRVPGELRVPCTLTAPTQPNTRLHTPG